MAEQMIQTTEKRVVCLYRVSTVGQVEKDKKPNKQTRDIIYPVWYTIK